MTFDEIISFLFETIPGIGILVGIVFVASFIVCIFMEKKTRKTFVDREATEDDWDFFDDDEEEEADKKSK